MFGRFDRSIKGRPKASQIGSDEGLHGESRSAV
jgi:hypothetical protein